MEMKKKKKNHMQNVHQRLNWIYRRLHALKVANTDSLGRHRFIYNFFSVSIQFAVVTKEMYHNLNKFIIYC